MTRQARKRAPRYTRHDQLAGLTSPEWEAWLRNELGAWLLRAPTLTTPRPFFPLAILSDELDPGGRLAYEITITCGGRTGEAARAATRILSKWSFKLDGVDGAVLLLRLCAQLGAPTLMRAIRPLLNSVPAMAPDWQDRLGLAVVAALKSRLTYGDLDKLQNLLESARVFTPMVAAELVAARARTSIGNLGLLIGKSPLAWPQPFSEAYTHLVGRLLEDRSPAELEEVFITAAVEKKQLRLLMATLLDLTAYDKEAYVKKSASPQTAPRVNDNEPDTPPTTLPFSNPARPRAIGRQAESPRIGSAADA